MVRRIILSLSLCMSPAACALFSSSSSSNPGGAGADSSQIYAAQIEQYRAEAKAQPGAYQPATLFAAIVKGMLGANTAPELDRPALVEEAVGYLDAVDEPQYVHAALADKGSLLAAAGRSDEALAAFRASLAETPNVLAIPEMLPLLASTGAGAEVPEICGGVRAAIEDVQRVNILMFHCEGAGDPMAWASAEDRATYAQFQQEMAQQQAQREAERQAEQERLQASFSQPDPAPSSSGSSGGASAPAPSGRSVSVKSDCKEKVRLFRGRVNGRYPGGGTYGWHSPNSITSYSLSGDDQLCIVTENDREIVSCAGSGSSLRVTESCTGFAPR